MQEGDNFLSQLSKSYSTQSMPTIFLLLFLLRLLVSIIIHSLLYIAILLFICAVRDNVIYAFIHFSL